ncbi:putative polysaccharide biosynthesis protein [Guggenheimella bovis]
MKEQSTSRGVFVLTAAGIVVKIVSLLYIPFLIQILTPKGHGIYAKAYDIFIFGYIVTNDSVTRTLSKSISELIGQDKKDDVAGLVGHTLRFMCFISIPIGLLLFILAPQLASWSEAPDTVIGLRFLATAIPVTAFLSVFRGYFQGIRQMSANAMSQIIEQIVNAVCSLGFAYVLLRYGLRWGIAGGTIGTVLGAVVALGYFLYVAKKYHIAVEPIQNLEVFRKMVRYLTPLVIGTLFQQLGLLADVFNVSQRLLDSGLTEDNAQIAYSYLSTFRTMINVPTVGIGALAVALLPAVSQAFAKGDEEALYYKLTQGLRATCIWAIPCSFGLSAISVSLSRGLYDGSLQRATLLMVGAFVVAFMAVATIQTILLQAAGRYWEAILPLTIGLIAKIISNYILVAIPSINILGAIISTYISAIVTLVLNSRALQREYSVKLRYWNYVRKPLYASLLMGATLYPIMLLSIGHPMLQGRMTNLTLIALMILIGGSVYSIALIFLKAISLSDVEAFSPKLAQRLPNFIKRRISE